ncbi:MAG: acyl carrier protein phosphodiesterase [Sediminibacterium sp.]
MNYLAHAYLSFNYPDILVGNMISDFVKGKKQYDYPLPVQAGIRLHRDIDGFTDHHPATRAAKQLFRPEAGLYAGAFMDVVYDHFLALDKAELTEEQWKDFVSEVYRQLTEREALLPERFARMLPYMSSQNWLFNYRFAWGMERSFEGVAGRAKYLEHAKGVFDLFNRHYRSLEQYYHDFFPDVKKYAQAQLAVRLNG